MERMKKRRPRRPLSLKWELIGIVLVCFVLPVIVFSVSTVALISENSERQTEQEVTYNFDAATRATHINLQNAVTLSRATSFDPTVRLAYEAYCVNGDTVALYGEVQGFLTRQYSYNQNILATMLFFTDDPFAKEGDPDKIYLVTSGPSGTRSSFNEMFRIYTNEVHSIVRGLSEEVGTDVRFVEHSGNLYLVRNIMNSEYVPYAMIVLQLNTNQVFFDITGMPQEVYSSVQLDDIHIDLGDGHVDTPAQASENTSLINTESGYTIWKRDGLESHEIIYASALENRQFANEGSYFMNILTLAIIMTVVLMALFIWFFYRNITKPVAALTDAAGVVRGGELGYRMNEGLHSSEFNSLAGSFNRMSARLKEMFEQNEQEQLALQDARIGALQSQINPHFLNNTLEIINWEARMAGATRVSEMIEALSAMLSGAMARSGETMVRVSEELAYLDSYLYIISARLGKRLEVKKEVEPAQLSRLVPRLIMQPLVENAVEHGILPRQKGRIVLRVYGEGDALILEVENDAALSPEREELIRQLLSGGAETATGKLGIRNVSERVRLIYCVKNGLTITSEGGNTLARLTLLPPDPQ